MKRLLLFVLLLSLPLAAQQDRLIPVKFAPGTSGATLVEGVARGETATFVLEAAAGQKMRIVCDSVEDNANFTVISPGGMEMGNSRPKDGRQVWYSVLPHTGPYHVIVGTTRGGAEIEISFTIR